MRWQPRRLAVLVYLALAVSTFAYVNLHAPAEVGLGAQIGRAALVTGASAAWPLYWVVWVGIKVSQYSRTGQW